MNALETRVPKARVKGDDSSQLITQSATTHELPLDPAHAAKRQKFKCCKPHSCSCLHTPAPYSVAAPDVSNAMSMNHVRKLSSTTAFAAADPVYS